MLIYRFTGLKQFGMLTQPVEKSCSGESANLQHTIGVNDEHFFFNLGATLTKPVLSEMTYSSSLILRCHFLNICCSHLPFLLFAANRLFAITLTSFHYVCLWK